jgi:ATP-binding cassette, subfamily C (CFTR/MRP), member 1
MELVDIEVMGAIQFFISQLFSGLTKVIVIGSVVPGFLAAMLPVCLAYYLVAQPYWTLSRDLTRLESISRSPIYAQFVETVTGISSIYF